MTTEPTTINYTAEKAQADSDRLDGWMRVLDRDGMKWERNRDGKWVWLRLGSSGRTSAELIADFAPLTRMTDEVIYGPSRRREGQ